MDRKTRPHTEAAAAELDRVAEFARHQADWANAAVADLRGLGRRPGRADWANAFWRITEQRVTATASAAGEAALSEPFTEPRRTRLGTIPWYGDGPLEDPVTHKMMGLPTWAKETFTAAGALAPLRFTAEGVTGDVLETPVRLTDGTTALGRKLVRGETAEEIAEGIRRRRAEQKRQRPAEGPALAPDNVFSVTSDQEERTRILNDAFTQLAATGEFTTSTWADIAYKLFHAPQRKSGSDAVARSFMAAVGVHHLGRVPDFPHDIDLLAMVTSQDKFIALVVEHDKGVRTGTRASDRQAGSKPGDRVGARPSPWQRDPEISPSQRDSGAESGPSPYVGGQADARP